MNSRQNRLLTAVFLLLALILPLLVPSQLFTQSARKPVKKNAIFSKEGKKTRVAGIQVAQGDTISWSDPGSDLYFQFMDSTLVGGYTYVLKKGDPPLTLTVKTAKTGTYQYAIFRSADNSFVVGNSPPVIIIP